MPSSSTEQFLRRALDGDREALGELLARFRESLRRTAERELSSRLKVRVDASDVVQATCLEAFRDLDQFAGEEVGQFVAWLQQILHNNIQQSIEMHRTAQMRNVDRERRLDDSQQSGGGLQFALAADQSSPSANVRRMEMAERLIAAIENLPPDQRRAAQLRYFEGMPLDQIADELQRSKMAAAGLLKRGLQNLRREFPNEFFSELL